MVLPNYSHYKLFIFRSKLQLSNQTKKKVLMDFKNNLKKKKKNKGLFSKLCAFWFPSSLVWTKFYFTISYCSLQILPGASVLALQEL